MRRTPSAIAWRRCHLDCHLVQDYLLSKRRILGPGEPKARHDHGAMTDDPGVVTGIGEQALPLHVKVRLSRGPPRPSGGSPLTSFTAVLWRGGLLGQFALIALLPELTPPPTLDRGR